LEKDEHDNEFYSKVERQERKYRRNYQDWLKEHIRKLKKQDRLKMKKTILISIIFLFSVLAFAEEQTVQERIVAVNIKITQTWPAKKAALETKTYTGTFAEIMTQRVADLNEVTLEAKGIVAEVNEICVLAGTPQPPKFTIIDTASKALDTNDVQKKEQNANFIKTVNEMVTDPSITDPCEIAAGQELLDWCVEVINTPEMGGM
jgi:Zn-dependent protease with chaperone function